jgi:hypothetical protein
MSRRSARLAAGATQLPGADAKELGASEMLAHDHGRPAAAAATPADDAFVRGLQSHPASEGLGTRINIL